MGGDGELGCFWVRMLARCVLSGGFDSAPNTNHIRHARERFSLQSKSSVLPGDSKHFQTTTDDINA